MIATIGINLSLIDLSSAGLLPNLTTIWTWNAMNIRLISAWSCKSLSVYGWDKTLEIRRTNDNVCFEMPEGRFGESESGSEDDTFQALISYLDPAAVDCIATLDQTLSEAFESPNVLGRIYEHFVLEWLVTGTWKDRALREKVIRSNQDAWLLREQNRGWTREEAELRWNWL